jgi:amino acid transporter
MAIIAVFVYGGWTALSINEEVSTAVQPNPWRSGCSRSCTLAQVGLPRRGVATGLRATANSSSALVYVANALGGGFWAKMMALSIALSVIATTGTGIVLSSRIAYGMASYRALPGFLSNVSRRFQTTVAASIIAGLLLIGLTWVYLLTTSVQNAFFNVIDTTGLLFAIFYILTALATIVYYRRRVLSSFWDFLILGVLPLGAAGFLGWMFTKSVQAAEPPQVWSLVGIIGLGLIMMLVARFILRSPFFQIRRESANSETLIPGRHASGR